MYASKIQTWQPCDETSYSNVYQKHVPNSFVYHVECSNENYKPPVEYSGEDAPKVFYQKLKEEELHITEKYYDKFISMIPLTKQEKQNLKLKRTATSSKNLLIFYRHC